MAKEKIPVFSIANLTARPLDPGDFMIERFEAYIGRHTHAIHTAHRHVFYHLVYFTGGHGSYSIDFTQFPVAPGQIYFMIPGQVHSWNFDGMPTGYIVNFSPNFLKTFLLEANYLDRFIFFNGNAAEGVVQTPSALQPKIVSLFEDMLDRYAIYAEKEPDLLRIQLLQLFLLLQSAIDTAHPVLPAVSHKKQLLTDFRRLIEQHYRTMRRPGEYAALLFITVGHLNSVCQELMGRAAGDVIRDRVLLEAKRLLTSADLTVTSVADELNFPDNSYFTRFFKKYEGATPEEFRKRIKLS